MEKLIELLNEYDEIREYVEVDLEDELISLRIISKWYWFIKRLVENDKIDKDYYSNYVCDLWEEFSMTSNIIMNLSIAENPIGYLIHMLK